MPKVIQVRSVISQHLIRSLIGAFLLLGFPVWSSNAVAANFPPTAALQLGTPSFTSYQFGTRMDRTLRSPAGVQIDASGRVLIADDNNNRIAAFNSLPIVDGAVIDQVVGNTSKVDYRSACTAAQSTGPQGMWSSGTKLAVADSYNNRVVLHNTFPVGDGASGNVFLGQSDQFNCYFTPGTTSASTLSIPQAVWTDGTKLVVSDSGSNRVLIWNAWPTTSGQPADLVLGQPDMVTGTPNTGGVSGARMKYPQGLWSDGTRLIVADSNNNRVLIWNTWPTANGEAANRVLGQPDMVTRTNYGCTAASLQEPNGVASDGTRILVGQLRLNRVSIFGSFPTVNNPDATLALGQANTNTCDPNNGSNVVGATGFGKTDNNPNGYRGVWTDGTKVLVSDPGFHRVLAWDSFPTASGQAASRVIGQSQMDRAGQNGMNLESVFSAGGGYYGFADGYRGLFPTINPAGGLVVGNADFDQVTTYASDPSTNNQPPTMLLGQTNTSVGTPNGAIGYPGAGTFYNPQGAWTNGTKLAIADSANGRVKIWNTFPTSTTQAPDRVLGAPNYTSFATFTASQNLIKRPVAIASDGVRLVVADQWANRVLIWNTWPTTDNQAADLVLGQPNFTSDVANNGGLGAQSMSSPSSVAMWGGKLAVADQVNNRILLWNTFPTTQRQPADAVFGQASFTSAAAGGEADRAASVSLAGNAMFFTQVCRARYIDPIPTTTAVTGSTMIGTGCSGRVASQTQYDDPAGISAYAGKTWIGSYGTARLLRFDDTVAPTITIAPTVTAGCGGATPTISWQTSESGSSEVYFGPASQASPAGYPSSSIDATMTGLGHSRTLGPLATGTYFYRVQTTDWAGLTVFSSERSFAVGSPVITDNQLGDDTWRNTNSGVYDVDLCDTGGLSSFEVRTTSGAGGAGALLQDWTVVSGLVGTTLTADWSLPSSTFAAMADGTNFVSVRATNAAASRTTLTDAFSVRKDTTPPPSVTTLTASTPTTSAPALTWTGVSDVGSGTSFYRIFRSTTQGALGTQVNTVNTTVSGTYTDTSLTKGGNYYYTIQAEDALGNVQTAGNNQYLVAYNPAIYLRTTASSLLTTSKLLSSTAGTTADTATKPTIGNGTTYIQFQAGTTGNTAFSASLPAAPSGKGWLYDTAPGTAYASGTWRFHVSTQASVAHTGVVNARAWKVTAAGAVISSLSSWTANMTNVGSATTLQNHFIDISMPSAVVFGAGEYLYVEYWESVTGASGNSTATVTFQTNTSAERIITTGPPPPPTVTSASPSSAVPGSSLTVQIGGTGLQNGAAASFSGSGITVATTTWVSSTRVDASISVAAGAALGSRTITVTNPDTQSTTASGVFSIVAPTLTIGFDAATVAIAGATPNADATATSAITVTTDNPTGYTLTATDASDTTAMTHTNAVDVISDWTGSPGSPSPWTAGSSGSGGYFGLTVLSATGGKDSTKWGTGTAQTDFTTLKYIGLQSATSSTLHARTTYSASADTINVSYRLDPSPTTRPGSYSSLPTYSAVANP